jgi:endonuclease/exonuclease/phosphatase family metal-dependent hydrolase
MLSAAPSPRVEGSLRVATYNIHKGVQGLGPGRRLEIFNLRQAVAHLDADLVCLQEVRGFHRRLAQRWAHWPPGDQAQTLSPEGFHSVYRTNAVTTHGEHGNALLSRWPVSHVGHSDVSDHALEQRGLLHAVVHAPHGEVHVVVVHLGLSGRGRWRQVQRLGAFLAKEVPPDAKLLVAGDFNDWRGRLHAPMGVLGLQTWPVKVLTFPARFPVWPLDRVYGRGLQASSAWVPSGPGWSRWSDHLPLVVDWEP